MEIVPFLAAVGLVHAALYFTDQFLKSCMNVPYIYFLENVGLWVKPLQLHWFTTAFNRSVTKWALWRPRFFRAWFSVGAVVVGLLLLPSLFLLISGLANHLRPTQVQAVATLQPMVPGLNIPMQELPYYFVTLLLASIIHEAGHAFAAVQEDVRVNGFGFLLMFILPGAYVDVPTEEIRALTPFRQLKVLCAGVWHNIVLVLAAVGLGLSAPYLLQPLYYQGRGLSVIAMTQDSPARGLTGLEVGDVITAVNRKAVVSVEEWRRALTASATQDQAGFCVPEAVVHDHDETVQHAFEGLDGSVQCCEGDSEAHLCFELLENREADVGVASMHPFSCLPARLAISKSGEACVSSATCPTDTHCLAPSLKNTTRLVQINRGARDGNAGGGGGIGTEQEDVLYLGPPAYLYHTVTVTSYVSKYSFLSASWPNTLEIYCDYMVKFSGALAVLNMVPVLYLDGYWIFGAVIDLFLAGRCDNVTRKVVHVVTTLLGSVLLFANIALGVWSLL
ncbi:membrane-bound transcription factor site-2 protease-like [Eriocheir sinensis]|uniref:membrane-bound transcription factor site-2 protease-like n=1 Tax=Eriocheir sinensis TaxID=95602 RepID=UPI0021CA174B|nr:membrane-bound transcription factor site-2 protease-like [Eriocheir sinensis]XP_050688070.1 membrane-bound transcription factor site-2 protease-like [Eriocheir sinensis]XP_050688071.1 membrane-bound transcription factor site-2 protease-like [Eriocheir sinensis]XP_050688072.1 membrane-bound transcription factor site-2 protease-like [Eriocheir sinensis]XP_050688073.1 membrane-bound transcription factor site-2 protease-like [Eriocheir sinensis]XP_050688074.1 membrane-bound transcription factor